MKIIKHGQITRTQDEVKCLFRYNGWPTVISLSDNTLLAAWSGDRFKHVCPFGKVKAARSTDGGHTWQPPYVLYDTPLDDRDAGLCRAGDTVLLTSFANGRALQRDHLDHKLLQHTENDKALIEAYLSHITDEDEERWIGSALSISTDNGYTFSAPVCDLPVFSPHGPTLLHNGEILYVGTVDVPAYRYGKALPDGVYATRLSKEGKVLGDLQAIALYPKDGIRFYEPHAAQMPNGDILVAIRAERSEDGLFTIYLCRSTDGGKSFGVPVPTGFEGAPAHLFVATDGTVILSYGRRIKPYGIRARISRDSGYTWSEELILRDNCVSGDLGYPSTTQNKQGELVTVYYTKPVHTKYDANIEYTLWTLD